MDLIAKLSGGKNIIARPQARAAFYPAGTVHPARVLVYWRYIDEPAAAARLIGTFSPTAEIIFPFNPLEDRDLILSTISIAADGTRSVRSIDDAHEEVLVFQRETAAPTVKEVRQLGTTSPHTRITLAVDGYSSLAIKRRIRSADDEAMSVNVEDVEVTVSPGDILPRVSYLDRTDIGTGTRTVWVRIAHSSGGDYGAESVAQSFTFANDAGADGSHETATGDPFGRLRFET